MQYIINVLIPLRSGSSHARHDGCVGCVDKRGREKAHKQTREERRNETKDYLHMSPDCLPPPGMAKPGGLRRLRRCGKRQPYQHQQGFCGRTRRAAPHRAGSGQANRRLSRRERPLQESGGSQIGSRDRRQGVRSDSSKHSRRLTALVFTLFSLFSPLLIPCRARFFGCLSKGACAGKLPCFFPLSALFLSNERQRFTFRRRQGEAFGKGL